MTRFSNLLVRCAIAAVAGFVGLSWNGDIPQGRQSTFVSQAEARIGRPLTPMSYAGVARRTTRRAVAVGGAVYGGGCTQVANAYGQIVTVCR